MIFIFMMLVLVGLLGMLIASIESIYAWAAVFGLGFGGMFSVAMSLLVLRSPTPQVAAALSGMAQGVGYFIAALAPLMVGVLHELTGDRSEEHTSELQSLMRISYAGFCLKKQN